MDLTQEEHWRQEQERQNALSSLQHTNKLVFWNDPEAIGTEMPERLYGLLQGPPSETGARVLLFDPDPESGIWLIIRDLPPGTTISDTGLAGIDALFEHTFWNLPSDAQRQRGDTACSVYSHTEEYLLDRLSDDVVHRFALGKSPLLLMPLCYRLHEHWCDRRSDQAPAHATIALLARRRRQFYEVALPAFLRTASLFETILLLRDADDDQRHLRPNWALLVEKVHWPILALPQSGRRWYRHMLSTPRQEYSARRGRALKASLAPTSDLLIETLVETVEWCHPDESIFRIFDPATWSTAVWNGLRPHLARVDAEQMRRMLCDHWGLPHFPTLVEALCTASDEELARTERRTALTRHLTELVEAGPYPYRRFPARLKKILPEVHFWS